MARPSAQGAGTYFMLIKNHDSLMIPSHHFLMNSVLIVENPGQKTKRSLRNLNGLVTGGLLRQDLRM